MSMNEATPPKKAVSVVKTPPVESASVAEISRKRSAEEMKEPTFPHDKNPPVVSERLSEERVSGSCWRKLAASSRTGGMKKKRTLKNTSAIKRYMRMTASTRAIP